MTAPQWFATLCATRPPVSSIQAAKASIGARIGHKLDARLIDLPRDTQKAVRLLAAEYRRTRRL